MSLSSFLDDPDHGPGRAFAAFIQVLILASLVSFSIETLPDLDPQTREYLTWFEIGTVAIFTFEYALRVIAAERKLEFIFSFFGLIDLLAIAPFYLGGFVDLRSLRILRVVRLVRILKLLRYTSAVNRFARAFKEIRAELMIYGVISVLLIYLAAVGIYYCESDAQPDTFGDVFKCLWWAIATLTTVGYGDVYPITAAGRIFTGMLLLVGLSIIAIPSGLIASALTAIRAEDAAAKEREAAGKADEGSSDS